MHLYIHIPFCKQKCQYCDFVSGVFSKEYQSSYVQALKNEIGHAFQSVDPASIKTVYIGGGTPSSLSAENLLIIYETLSKYINIGALDEFTIEANPETVTLEFAILAAEGGVNRVSLGVQSTNEEELALLGRLHDFAQVEKAVEIFRQVGIQNINLDLIFAIPNQTIKKLSQSMKKITDLKPSHISCYSLIIEEGTPLMKKLRDGIISEIDEDYYVTQYRYVIDYLSSKGYKQYEISNFALEGFESQHNTAYWTGSDYIGLGASAHSKIGNKRFANVSDIDGYILREKESTDFLQSVDESSIEFLSPKDLYNELIFLGLRRSEGILFADIAHALDTIDTTEIGISSKDIYTNVYTNIRTLSEEGLLHVSDKKISLTQMGREISNTVFTKLML